MKVKELIEALRKCPGESQILIGGDEELNMVFQEIEVGTYGNDSKIVLWGNSGSELEDEE